VDLTPLEFLILEILMKSPGQVIRRAELCIRLMENGYTGSESTLKIHIRNIRQKLDDDLEQPKYIETVFGIGYRFIEPAA
jgi:two-component system, OmpR family, alkaline phosphatase synthesis response regulator PhoP